ncbi:hypothetical protein CYMTET_15878 [Cymbomonas tetramitiformis]|uniref:Uncharacterized protein n=1 Tax=Cymbomonas tetramitiformis TaxID=36881 RepID=A0AAE0GD40_9CHLO|nr:hypothetical protein CYMTET_15878 [Cymbomonas tetramitiformis]
MPKIVTSSISRSSLKRPLRNPRNLLLLNALLLLGILPKICSGVSIASTASNFASSGAASIAASITSLYPFSDGTSGTCISDGGYDMYDCGNKINIKSTTSTWSNDLAYTQSLGLTSTGNSDITYITYKSSYIWLAAFESNSGNIMEYKTTGNNGADGGGSVSYGALGASSTGGYYGWYKRVYLAGNDPSINELILTTSSSWSHSASTNTDDGTHSLAGTSGVTSVFYIMWAGTAGYSYGTSVFTSVMNTFLSSCLGTSLLRVHILRRHATYYG